MPIRRVEATGPKTASIALVGEAPGAWEVREGKPFVGPAGALLNQLLSSVGISRTSCYITNVIKEQPPRTTKKANDVSTFIELDKKAIFKSLEFEAYREELRQELEQTEANVFVAFGNVPLYALTNIHPPKIIKRRGSMYESTLVPGRKVVATIHPAACLYGGDTGGMYIWRYFILNDLRKAIRHSRDRYIDKKSLNLITLPTVQNSVEFLDYILKNEKTVAFDIEVLNLEVYCISFAFADKAQGKTISISIPFVYKGSDYMSMEDELIIWDRINAVLSDPSIAKIGQNLSFDTQFLFRKYGIVTKNIQDTMVAQGVLVPEFPKGLDFIASLYTDIPYYKDEGKQYFKIGGDEINFFEYNAKDSAVCSIAYPRLLQELQTKNNDEAYYDQKDLIECLVCMSERGIRMDIDGMKARSAEAGKRIEELTEQLNRIAGREINWNSTKQLMEYLYDEKGYKEYKKRGSGNRTVDVDALKRLSRLGCSEASILQEVRRLAKLKSTYLDVTLDSDGRLRCSFNPVGAADSGRLSSSKTIWATGMNIQNDPPEFKKFMLFDEGYIGYNIDLSQAENRIVAYIAPEPRMIQAFEDGVDVHKTTASLMFGVPLDQVTSESGTCPVCSNPELCGHEGQRFFGKKSNHSFNYGLGYRTFAFMLEIEERLGKHIWESYHSIYPGVQIMWNWIKEELESSRTLVNILGRKRIFLERWGEGLWKEAYSYIPQSTVAGIINKRGLLHVYNTQDSPVELLNQVHDSIVFQISKSFNPLIHVHILNDIIRSLEQPLCFRGREFVIPADVAVGCTNMKDMKKVKDKSKLEEEIRKLW